MWRTTASLTLLSLLVQLAQLALQLLVARLYGTSAEVDAYVAAMTAPALLSTFLLAAGSPLAVASLSREWAKGPEDYARARDSLGLVVFVLCALFALLVGAFPRPVLGVLVPGLSGQALAIAPLYTRWGALSLLPGALSAYLTSAHHVRQKFLAPAAAGVTASAVALGGFLVVHPSWGIEGLVICQFAAALLSAFWLASSEYKAVRWIWSRAHPVLAEVGGLFLPVVVSTAASRVNMAVDRFFASFLPTGNLAVLHYADRWVTFSQAVLSLPLVAVLYTRMARAHAHPEKSARAGEEAFQAVTYVGAALAAWTWLASPELAAALLSGAAPAGSVQTLSDCLRAYAGVLALGGFGSILARAYYVRGDTRTPMILGGLLPMALNVILDWLFVKRFGVVGLAAVTSLNAFVGVPLAAWVLRRRAPEILGRDFALTCLRSALSCAFLGPLLWALRNLLPGDDLAAVLARLAIFSLAGPALYLATSRLLGSQEARQILTLRKEAPLLPADLARDESL